MSEPQVQLALDVTDVESAIRLGHIGLNAGADWLEVGKPLIEFEGLNGVRRLVQEFHTTPIVLDLMVMAAPERYIRAAAEAGAFSVTVTALAPEITVLTAVDLGRKYGVDVTVDLFNVSDVLSAAARFAAHGAPLMVHFGVDQKRASPDGSPIAVLAEVTAGTDVRVSYATYDLDESIAAVAAGADVIVQGEPLLSSPHFEQSFTDFVRHTRAAANTGATPGTPPPTASENPESHS